MDGTRAAWIGAGVAAVAAVVLAATLPFHLTDGDSCLYAAFGNEIVRGVAGAWVAPRWDDHGTWTCFHEHPPGAFWVSALVEFAGAPGTRAALVANALWQIAAASGVYAVARRFLTRPESAFAALVFLLHLPVLRYVQRAGLELPLAATATWSLAAALRLGRSRAWTLLFGVAMGGAFLVRGVFGFVPVLLAALLLVDRELRPPPLRLLGGFGLAAAMCLAFDHLHARATGHGFWAAYLDRQVLPSFAEGGTAHSGDERAGAYFLGRALLYTLPWALLPLVRIARSRRAREPLPHAPAWRLAAVWFVVTVIAAAAGTRAASRYLFVAYPASALLAALAVAPWPTGRAARAVVALALLAVPASIVVKSATKPHDAWWRTADALRTVRTERGPVGARVTGDDTRDAARLRSFLRFHLGPPTPTSPRWLPSEPAAQAADAQVLATTPLGRLAE